MDEVRKRLGAEQVSLDPVLVATRPVSALPFGFRPSALHVLERLGVATEVLSVAMLGSHERSLLWCSLSEADGGRG